MAKGGARPGPGRSRGSTSSKNCWLTRADDAQQTLEASVRGLRQTRSDRTSSAPVSALQPRRRSSQGWWDLPGLRPSGPRNTRISRHSNRSPIRATRPGRSTRLTRTPTMQHGRTYGVVDEDTTLAALAGSRPRGRPAALRHIREQRHLACSLDRDRKLTLVPAARSAHPTRPDLPSVGRVPAELIDVLVVDLSHLVLAEETRLPPEHLRLAAARTSWARSWLAVLPSFRLRRHAVEPTPNASRVRPGGHAIGLNRVETATQARQGNRGARRVPTRVANVVPTGTFAWDPCDTRHARTPFAVAAGPRG